MKFYNFSVLFGLFAQPMAILTPLERKLLENPDPFWKPDLEVLYLKMLHEHNMGA